MRKIKEPSPTPNDIRKIVNSQKDFTIDSIQKSLSKKKNRFFSLEQKLLALKLLQLNSMDYSTTERQIKITRHTLYTWQKQLGDAAFEAEPEYRIAEKIETNLAMIKHDMLVNGYSTMNETINKIKVVIGTASTIKHMHSLAEGLLALAEVMKNEKEIVPDQPKASNNFFMQIHEAMMLNIPSEPTDKSHGNKD
jgi:hypothetical protein